MEKITREERPAMGLDSVHQESEAMYPGHTIQMYFTSNHDENSWSNADYGTFPGAVHAPFVVFTQTMAKSVPLIYGGQEEPVLRALQFFDKDPMTFDNLQRSTFYKTPLNLRKTNVALSADASFKKVSVGDDKAVYAFVREKEGEKVLVILNLSPKEQAIIIKNKTLLGSAFNTFKRTIESLSKKEWTMHPWGYAVYEYNLDYAIKNLSSLTPISFLPQQKNLYVVCFLTTTSTFGVD